MVPSDVDTAAETAARGHPLAFLAGHYTIQADAFLGSIDRSSLEPSPRGSALDVVSWYHALIPLQTHRALRFAYQAKLNAPERLADALASANVVLLAIDRSLSAWQTLAAGVQAPRVDALIEILEALRTAVELRFPDAGDAISARAIGSDDSSDECAGERP
jgi:hypothetical protein